MAKSIDINTHFNDMARELQDFMDNTDSRYLSDSSYPITAAFKNSQSINELFETEVDTTYSHEPTIDEVYEDHALEDTMRWAAYRAGRCGVNDVAGLEWHDLKKPELAKEAFANIYTPFVPHNDRTNPRLAGYARMWALTAQDLAEDGLYEVVSNHEIEAYMLDIVARDEDPLEIENAKEHLEFVEDKHLEMADNHKTRDIIDRDIWIEEYFAFKVMGESLGATETLDENDLNPDGRLPMGAYVEQEGEKYIHPDSVREPEWAQKLWNRELEKDGVNKFSWTYNNGFVQHTHLNESSGDLGLENPVRFKNAMKNNFAEGMEQLYNALLTADNSSLARKISREIFPQLVLNHDKHTRKAQMENVALSASEVYLPIMESRVNNRLIEDVF